MPVGASRETVKRSEFAGYAAYGYCASHSRYFWGLRLYLLCAPDGMPTCVEFAPANAPEREVAAEMLEGVALEGYAVIADKRFAGEDFERLMGPGRGLPASRPQGRGAPLRGARRRSPVGRVGHRRDQTSTSLAVRFPPWTTDRRLATESVIYR